MAHLFSTRACPKKSGPKGPSEALIQAIVELKSRNPRFGCPRIARIISHTFGVDIDKNVVHRVLATHYRPTSGGTGPSWLSFIGHTTDSLWSVDLFRCESIVLRTQWCRPPRQRQPAVLRQPEGQPVHLWPSFRNFYRVACGSANAVSMLPAGTSKYCRPSSM